MYQDQCPICAEAKSLKRSENHILSKSCVVQGLVGGKGCSDSQFTTGGLRLVLAVSQTARGGLQLFYTLQDKCEPRFSPRASEDKSRGGTI